MSMKGRVLLTGGSGYLGRAILRRAERENWPAEFIVYSRDELKQAQCRRKYPNARYVLGDVRDTERLRLVMIGCDTVIHTAALKYVPEAEYNVSECIDVNVGGTRSLFSAALDSIPERIVVISTDKAVEPANVYGMTKALCERLVGETNQFGAFECVAVRYGNVIGSTGSVVPEMLARHARGEQITLTDPSMTRFWLGVDEAIDIILCALTPAVGNGSVLIPSPRSMELGDLLQALIPYVEVEVVGLRPGEKMHETLLTEDESMFVESVGRYYELPSLSERRRSSQAPFTVDSCCATRMEGHDFMTLVEDSKSV